MAKLHGQRQASLAYQELTNMGLNPAKFLPSLNFMATRADIENLPDEAWLRQVQETAYDILRPLGRTEGAK